MIKKRIFQLITSIQLGGAEIVAFNLSEACKASNPDEFEFVIIELFASNDPYANEKRKELESKNILIKTLSRKSKRISLLWAPFCLFRYILREKPQIIHSHTDLPDFVLATAIRLLKIIRKKPIIIVRTIHNSVLWPTHHAIGRYVESTFIEDRIAAVSASALNAYRLMRKRYMLAESIHQEIIYNGCVVPEKQEINMNLNPERLKIAFCGRFEYQKGIDILINRIMDINQQHQSKIQFIIIGEGTFKNQVLKLLNVYDNIIYSPPISNIANKLHSFDFIIMPSRFEGLGLISLEASFAGVPVIAANSPGLAETLPADWPLLFELENKKSLLSIVEKVVHKVIDKDDLKKEAMNFVQNKFSKNKMVESYTKLYQYK